MNNKKYFVIGAFSLFGFFVFWTYAYGAYLNGVAATMGWHRSKGQDLVRYIEHSQNHGVLWPTEKGTTNFLSSTDYINAINEAQGIPRVTPEQNIWTIVKNLPSNAPDNFIVLATRNIDPKCLRLSLTEDQMNDALVFLPKEKKGLLKKCFIVIRKDGSGFIAKSDSTYCGATLRYVYDNRPFDLTTNLVDYLPVRYLTPDGEVLP